MLDMKTVTIPLAIAIAAVFAPTVAPAQANSQFDIYQPRGNSISHGSGVLQCVPYARNITGIRLFRDAHTWGGVRQPTVCTRLPASRRCGYGNQAVWQFTAKPRRGSEPNY